jgi:hypothetical protein
MLPWSQGADSCPAREGEAGSPGEVRATVGRGNVEQFPLQVDFRIQLTLPEIKTVITIKIAVGSSRLDNQ